MTAQGEHPKCRWCNRPKVPVKWAWLCLMCDGPDKQAGERRAAAPCWLDRVGT